MAYLPWDRLDTPEEEIFGGKGKGPAASMGGPVQLRLRSETPGASRVIRLCECEPQGILELEHTPEKGIFQIPNKPGIN